MKKMWVTTWLSDFSSNQGSHSKSKTGVAFGWTIGFVKNVSYYRCGPLTAAYIDKN